MREPPNAAAVVATTVMPIWTVARNRSGSARSAATVWAPTRFSSTSWATRVRRSETIAISAPANTPFASVRARMTISSVKMRRLLLGRVRPAGT